MSRERFRILARRLLALTMCAIGVTHFVFPHDFAAIVPDYLPAPLALVIVSGIFEISGGVGLLIPSLRRAASIGLILLYLSVFPANLYMAMHDIPIRGHHLGVVGLWLRLPFQLVFIAWAWWAGKPDRDRIPV